MGTSERLTLIRDNRWAASLARQLAEIQFPIGSTVQGVGTIEKPFGFFFQINDSSVVGLIHKSHTFFHGTDLWNKLKVGSYVEGTITRHRGGIRLKPKRAQEAPFSEDPPGR